MIIRTRELDNGLIQKQNEGRGKQRVLDSENDGQKHRICVRIIAYHCVERSSQLRQSRERLKSPQTSMAEGLDIASRCTCWVRKQE
jgi:hypothetical protein